MYWVGCSKENNRGVLMLTKEEKLFLDEVIAQGPEYAKLKEKIRHDFEHSVKRSLEELNKAMEIPR